MEIKTKYNLGDKVWVVRNHKLAKITIDGISLRHNGLWCTAFYNCESYPEEACFKTKEELLAYIVDGVDEEE